MAKNKTNTNLLEVPTTDTLLPPGDTESGVFTELVKDEELYNNDFKGFMSKAQQL